MNREHLGRKTATFAAVILVGFLCGWSASGLTGGVLLALASATGVAVPIFGTRTGCSLRSLGRWGRTSQR